jgi:putative FmdB family regulatory protein
VPVYEYQCPDGHRFEVRQGYHDEPVLVCPECGCPVRRVIHPVGIVFKGSGFYATDSRKSPSATKPAESKSEAKSESSSESPSESGSDKKSDSSASGDTKSDVKTVTGGDSKT